MAAIVQAFEADRVELHLQPIVALPQRKVRSYEALARLRLADETILVPAEFLPLLERLGHAAEFDRRSVGRAIAIARHLMARGSEAIVSVNLSPRSLQEPGFLRSVGRLFDAYPDTVGRVVLELSQRCWRTLDAERAGGLASLRDKGIPFALDRASDLRLDPLALADRGVRFVKLPADLMIGADHGRGLDIEIGDLASVLRRAGIKLIAERVEQEEIVPDLIDLDIPLAQGFVFAPPRAVRAEVLHAPIPAERQPVEAPLPPQPEEPAATEERLPFRAFLRRAG
jgi:cyclic-di-GMP phosphodiesterase TipF (flagellum assembly factor)